MSIGKKLGVFALLAFLLFLPNARGDVIVNINPSSQTVDAGESFTVDVFCTPDRPIKAFEFRVHFDPTLLQANGVIEGDIFSGYPTFFNAGTINNTSGEILDIYGLIMGQGNVSNPGTFVTINFTAKETFGVSPVGLSNVGVTNETGYVPVIVNNGSVTVQNIYDLVFIHHSCGSNWLSNSLHAALLAKDYIDERNDITYGTDLSPDSGRPDSLAPTPGDKTNMNHWILWFNDYLEGVKDHGTANGYNKIIMFKSCYPASDVGSDGTEPGSPFSSTKSIVNYKAVYRHYTGPGNTYSNGGYTYQPLEDIFAANPDILFIPVIAPPLHYGTSSDPNAHRARVFNNWLKTDWLDSYNSNNPDLNNVFVYDWFNFLAHPDDHSDHPNRLKGIYGGGSGNSHPNALANAESTTDFATGSSNFIDSAWDSFQGGSPSNNPPSYSNPSPSNGATGVPVTTSSLQVTITDSDGNSFDWSIITSPNIGSCSGSGESGGVKSCSVSGLQYGQAYTWTVSADDGEPGGSSSTQYSFTVEEQNNPPIFSGETPVDGAIHISIGLEELCLTIDDPEDDNFEWTIDPPDAIGAICTVGSDTDGIKCCGVSGLSPDTTYAWDVSAIDTGSGEATTASYSFTTGSGPVVSNPNPGNGEIDVSVTLSQVSVDISDPDGDLFDWYINCMDGVCGCSGENEGDGTVVCSVSGLEYNTLYFWYVDVTDGNIWTNETFSFQTELPASGPPYFVDAQPANATTDVSVGISSLQINITDPEGNPFNWTITTSPSILNGTCSGTMEAGGVKSCTILDDDLNHDTTYYWYVSAYDGSWNNKTYWFETESPPSTVPSVSLVSPDDGASTTNTLPVFSYRVTDTDNATVDCTLYVSGSVKATATADADGSVSQLEPSSALSFATHNWYISCTDGANTANSSIRSLKVYKSSNGGGGGGGNGGGGGGGDEPPRPPKYNVTYNLSKVSENEIKDFVEISESARKVLAAAGLDAEDPEVVNQVALATKMAYENCFAYMWITHPDVFSTDITVKIVCTGTVIMEDVVVFIEIPKSFDQNADDITVTADPETEIVVVESDPTYSFKYDQLSLGTAEYTFYTKNYANRDTVVGEWKKPWFFLGEMPKHSPPGCGDGIKGEGEECDGSDGTMAGYSCTIECKLEKIPARCVDDGVCTGEEELLGNCVDCAYVPQCVDDLVCSAEEQLIGGCRDCEASPIVLPNEFVPAFLWVRASAGTLLLLGAIVLLGAVAHLWMKRHEKASLTPTKKKPKGHHKH